MSTLLLMHVWLCGGWLYGVSAVAAAPAPARHEYTQIQMGVPWKILFYATDQNAANKAAEAAFGRIEALNRVLSDYDPESELSRLSKASPTAAPVAISDDLWHVLAYSQQLAEKTDGAFDVTVGPLTRLWRRARRSKQMPPQSRLDEALAAVGYEALRLNEEDRSAELTKPNMRLDLGGIAMGYAADEALKVLRKHGIHSAMIDASGDILLGDPPPGEAGWKIGIAPLQPDAEPSHYVTVANTAITTSGDAFQFVEIGGQRYSHIVDPRTGLGLTTVSSVTVIAPTCIAADSLATAATVLGPQQGLKLIENTPDAAAIIVIDENGKPRTYPSQRFADLVGPK